MGALFVTTAGRLRNVGFIQTVAFLAILELVAVGYAANNLIAATNLKKENANIPTYVSPVKIVRPGMS